ncbi:hypothetical protein HDG32_005495 [Paraburkholderia sp. CI2]|uniref:hypothetical protein n=1 Tax=Paraburkholderia sp. CI2 TaxID=2723093 RepID=UPI0016160086|nr:hypothetical protein [Paraburkholderia sp. CI2]MBB5469348.1 hypothetical protein [Paraburkholderia sp. CI2]
MKTMEDRWTEFAVQCISPNAPAIQFQVMRIAFYAGFKAMLDVDEELTRLTDEAAILTLERFYRESRNFIASIKE